LFPNSPTSALGLTKQEEKKFYSRNCIFNTKRHVALTTIFFTIASHICV